MDGSAGTAARPLSPSRQSGATRWDRRSCEDRKVPERHRILGLVPARGGSKGLPGKHLADLGGRPVLAWTAAAALASQLLDRIILSTEDEDIAALGRKVGLDVPFSRPVELAGDDVPSAEVIRHAVDALGEVWDYVVLLQPTSPLRATEDIDAAIRLCHECSAPACVSVSPVRQHPDWMFRIAPDRTLEPVLDGGAHADRRQDLSAVFALNGAVYVASGERLSCDDPFVGVGSVAYVMPPERSVDLDTQQDLFMLRTLVENR